MIQEGAGNTPQQAFTQWNDPQGNKLIALNRDGTIYAQGIAVVQGVVFSGDNTLQTSGAVAIIQGKLQAINVDTPQSISVISPEDEMYAASLYLDGNGDGQSTDLLVATLTWIDTSIEPDVHTASIQIVGNSLEISTATYSLFVKGGTAITLATSFTASPFHYDVSVRLVRMP